MALSVGDISQYTLSLSSLKLTMRGSGSICWGHFSMYIVVVFPIEREGDGDGDG